MTYNERVRRQVARQAPGREQVTIANGTDLTRFRPPEPGERERLRAALGWDARPRALFAGRLVAKKGFEVALDAARRAGGAFRFVVAGPERLPGAPADVELLGRLAPERLAEVYRACDAIVIPSFGEGLPLTAQEAMASGLPVVITDDPGYRSQLAPAGPAVRLVPSGVEALAAALRAAVRGREEEPDAVAAMVAFARETFSWERTADAHEALYERLLSSRSGVATWRRGAGSGS